MNTGLNILLKGDVLAGFFSTDAGVIQKGFDYLKGFAPETLVTAVLFSMIGYFNGNNQTIWVMVQGLIQTLLVRLPMAYFMSIQPDQDRTCSTGIYHSGNYSEHRILSVLHPCEKRNCFGRMTG